MNAPMPTFIHNCNFVCWLAPLAPSVSQRVKDGKVFVVCFVVFVTRIWRKKRLRYDWRLHVNETFVYVKIAQIHNDTNAYPRPATYI